MNIGLVLILAGFVGGVVSFFGFFEVVMASTIALGSGKFEEQGWFRRYAPAIGVMVGMVLSLASLVGGFTLIITHLAKTVPQ